jgi:hypothetical protein
VKVGTRPKQTRIHCHERGRGGKGAKNEDQKEGKEKVNAFAEKSEKNLRDSQDLSSSLSTEAFLAHPKKRITIGKKNEE